MSDRPAHSSADTSSSGPSVPSVSLVLAVYDPPIWALEQQLASIAGQSSSDWECIAVDDASTDATVNDTLTDWASQDRERRRVITRPVNGGIAAATNDGLELARGHHIALVDHDDVLHRGAVASVIEHFDRHPEHGVVYTDEQTVDEAGAVIATYDKPDWSPRRHLGHHYLAHLVAARRDIVGDIRVRQEFEPSQDYDFYLRVIEAAQAEGLGVGHIPEILYSWRAISGSSALDAAEKPEMVDAVRRCVDAAVERRGLDLQVETVRFRGAATTSCRLVRPTPDASIELLTISASTTSEAVNAAVRTSRGDVICLVDDAASHGAQWARPLVALSTDDGVGAAGPKIVERETGTLLSTGRILLPRLNDQFMGSPDDSSGPWGSLFVEREVSALAPLGFTIRRSVFDHHGGLPEDLGLDAAVAELCGRIRASGDDVVWTPQTTMAVTPPFGPDEGLFDPAGDDARNRDAAALASRSPAHEQYDAIGFAHLERRHHDAHAAARQLLAAGEIDLVTSDVFDTLVTRPVATPSDLFLRLADLVPLPDHVTAPMFVRARRDAERRARRDRSDARRRALRHDGADDATIVDDPEVAAPEVSLDEIWERMPVSFGDLDAMRESELALEGETLAPIPETVSMFELARRLGVPVVLVSDIYLTSTQLRGALEAAGIDMTLVDDVVTSLDHRLGKAHGLLAATIDRRGVPRERVLHLGDNEIADLQTAENLGARAAHFDVPAASRAVATVPVPLRDWSASSGTDLGISATVRSTLVAAPAGIDPSYQFGVAAVGPALAGFSRWTSDTAAGLGGSHVHCMLREGATIAELMGITAPDGPMPVRIHVSRWVTMRAAVIDGSREQLLTSLSRRADLTAAHVTDAFGCDIDLVRTVIGGDVVPAAEVDDACAALAAHDEARAAIVDGAAALRRRVLTYLHDRLVIDDGPIVVADVGWGGTIQEGLTRILRTDGVDNEIVGLYLAMSRAGEERVARGARMLSYLPNVFDDSAAAEETRAVAHHADTIERVMTPAIGTLLDIDASGQPITRDDDHDRIPPTLADAQQGVRDVVARLADPTRGVSHMADERWHDAGLRRAFAATLADVVVTPSTSAGTALGSWPHDDVAGTDHRAIADAQLADAVRYANVHDVNRLDPHGRRWIAGVAARNNRALVAQLGAEHRGVDIDDLSPTGELGIARLAAFEIGDEQARCQHAGTVRQLPDGWSLLRLDDDLSSLRSLRFDAGEHTAVVDVDRFDIRLGLDRGGEQQRAVSLDDDDLLFIDGHRIDPRTFVHRPGGHLLLQIDPDLAPHIRSIRATIGFRAVRLAEDNPLAMTPLKTRATDQARRVRSAVRRRL